MGRDSSFLVMFDNPAITIDDAARVLRKATRQGNSLEVEVPGGTHISIGLSAEPHVIVESAEIADDNSMPGIAKCNRRFECLVDDLEAALQDYNVLFEVQEALQTLTKGWILLSWNGSVLEPE